MTERTNFDHYVSQHFIKLFSSDEGLFVGSLQTRQVATLRSTSRIMGRENWSVTQNIEDGFTQLEDKVARSLVTLKNNPESLKGFSKSTLINIRKFICMHAARSIGLHDMMNQTQGQMNDILRKAQPSIEKSLTADQTPREESFMLGINYGDAIQRAISTKGCISLIAPQQSRFILGDNPLAVLSSSEQWQYRGSLDSRKTYLWFPLNPKTGLLFGEGLGSYLGTKTPLKQQVATKRLINTLNRAEVYIAKEFIAGSSKGLIKGKLRLPNVGIRSQVTNFEWAPFIINENKAVAEISESIINELRS